jgi:hypothetical protein
VSTLYIFKVKNNHKHEQHFGRCQLSRSTKHIMFRRMNLTPFQVVHWEGAVCITGPPVINKPIGWKMSKTLATLMPIYHCQNPLKWFQGLSALIFSKLQTKGCMFTVMH